MISCSSDDDSTANESPQTNSKFTVSGTEYSIPKGYIILASDGTNNSVHSIYLLNGTIINNEWNGDGCDFSNSLTQGVIFNIRSTSITELAPGTYNYELMTSQPSLNESNISRNVVVTNNCVVSSNDINENQITSGNLVVAISGNMSTLTFTFETADFGTVIGTYAGELELVQDLSD